jgi:hypothetical protein
VFTFVQFVVYTLLCEPRLTEAAIGNLEFIAHTAEDGVQFLSEMEGRCGGGGVLPGQCVTFQLLHVFKTLYHITVTVPVLKFRTRNHNSARLLRSRAIFICRICRYDLCVGFCDGNSVHAVAEYQKLFRTVLLALFLI